MAHIQLFISFSRYRKKEEFLLAQDSLQYIKKRGYIGAGSGNPTGFLLPLSAFQKELLNGTGYVYFCLCSHGKQLEEVNQCELAFIVTQVVPHSHFVWHLVPTWWSDALKHWDGRCRLFLTSCSKAVVKVKVHQVSLVLG